MNKLKYVILVGCFLYLNASAQDQKQKTPQDAIEFILQAANDNKSEYDVPSDHIVQRIFQMGVLDSTLYIYTQWSSSRFDIYTNKLFVITLPKVRIDDSKKMFADKKEDIGSYQWTGDNDIPKKFYKLGSLGEQNAYFIKHVYGKKFEAIGNFDFLKWFATNDPRFKENHYDERITKAFDFIIKYYGGGKTILDNNSKF